MDPGNKSRRVGPKASSLNRERVNLPARTLIKNGIIDRSKVYYILKNPEEPKCKVTISALLKQYQEHKRKALNVSRNSNFDESMVKNLDLLIEGNVEFDQLPKEFRQNFFLSDNFTDSESYASPASGGGSTTTNNMINSSTDESSSSEGGAVDNNSTDEKVQSKSSVFNLSIA